MRAVLVLVAAITFGMAPGVLGQSPDAVLGKVSLQSLGFKRTEASRSGLAFRNPPEIRSRHGLLKETLIVAYSNPAMTRIGSDKLIHVRCYNGRLIGPTLRVQPGDTIKLHLINRLPPETAVPPCSDFKMPVDPTPSPATKRLELLLQPRVSARQEMMKSMGGGDPMTAQNMDTPHGFNTTNIHTHGMHVSPSGHSDNVFVEVKPGQDFYYTIHVPLDQAAGTYWYHAHKHGSVATQLASSMSGALLVDGGMDRQPTVKAAKERVFVFQQLSYLKNNKTGLQEVECFDDSFGPGTWAGFVKTLGRRTTINGLRQPVIEMRPGAVERWRFIHGGIRENIDAQLIGPVLPDSKFVPSYPLYPVAYDGLATGTVTKERMVMLAPAYRADVFVKAPMTPGKYYLYDSPTPKGLLGIPEDGAILATINVRGSAVAMSLPKAPDLAPYKQTRYIKTAEITGHQDATYGIYKDSAGVHFHIDGRSYSMDEPARKLYLGDVDEWDLRSDPKATFAEPHPFHIHVNSFQITSIDGYDPFLTPLLSKDKLNGELWKDTLLMQQDCVYHVRMRYEDFTGKFVDHCHILDHEDQGMMENVEILKRRTSVNLKTGAVNFGRHAEPLVK